jgi:hypothetical protein
MQSSITNLGVMEIDRIECLSLEGRDERPIFQGLGRIVLNARCIDGRGGVHRTKKQIRLISSRSTDGNRFMMAPCAVEYGRTQPVIYEGCE